MRPRKFDDKTRNEALHRLAQGESALHVSQSIGCSINRIYRWRRSRIASLPPEQTDIEPASIMLQKIFGLDPELLEYQYRNCFGTTHYEQT